MSEDARVNVLSFPADGSQAGSVLRFSQVDFDLFASLSGDSNPIHVDPVFATGTRFGRTVAHGMLLFAATHAAINRWIGGPLRLHAQQLMFPAPTFADEDAALRLTIGQADSALRRRVEISLEASAGKVCQGSALVGFDEPTPEIPPVPEPESGSNRLKGMAVGMRSTRIRVPSRTEVRALTELVDDPHPDYQGEIPAVPPPLMGGMISDLLGVSLPGPGANWLKQSYRFHRSVSVGERLRASATITRLRPAKELVNLRTVCETATGRALTGEALVLVRDVVDRSGREESALPPSS
jgi:acyl dehydratase